MAVKDFIAAMEAKKRPKPAPEIIEIPHQVFRGPKGEDGKDGFTPVKGIDYRDGIDGKDGVDGKTGPAGRNGLDGRAGRDADSALIEQIQKQVNAMVVHEASPEPKKEFTFLIVRDHNGFIKEVIAKEI